MKRALFAAIAVSMLVTGVAHADDADTERARTFFNAGAQAYAAGKYTDAVRSFEQAYALAPRPTVLFSLAQAERKEFLDRGDVNALRFAISHYTEYLRVVPSGGRRPEALEAKAELEARLAKLDPKENPGPAVDNAARTEKRKPRVTVFSPTPGAQVSIDGGAPSELPYFADLEPGKHRVRVFGEGFFDAEQEISGDKGIDVPVNLPLSEKPALVSIELTSESDVFVDGHLVARTPLVRPLEVPSGPHVIAIARNGSRAWSQEVLLERAKPLTVRPSLQASGQRALSITMIAGGGLLVGLGAGFTLGALIQQNKTRDIEGRKGNLTENQRLAHNEAIDRRDENRVAAISLGATGAAIVAGGILFYVFDRPPVALVPPRTFEPTPKPALDVAFSPTIGPGLYGGGLTGRF